MPSAYDPRGLESPRYAWARVFTRASVAPRHGDLPGTQIRHAVGPFEADAAAAMFLPPGRRHARAHQYDSRRPRSSGRASLITRYTGGAIATLTAVAGTMSRVNAASRSRPPPVSMTPRSITVS